MVAIPGLKPTNKQIMGPFLDDPMPISVDETERERAERFRTAALLGYGALLAGNVDGKLSHVLHAMDAVLFPTKFEADESSTQTSAHRGSQIDQGQSQS